MIKMCLFEMCLFEMCVKCVKNDVFKFGLKICLFVLSKLFHRFKTLVILKETEKSDFIFIFYFYLFLFFDMVSK